MIQYLKWDSDFFEKKIGKLETSREASIQLTQDLVQDYDLIYIFSPSSLEIMLEPIDIKVTFQKKTKHKSIDNHVVIYNKNIHNYEELLSLVYLSGHDSRFLKDSFFGEIAYKKLYKRWIDNAIQDFNELVVIYVEDQNILGFITVSKNLKSATIGLVAVSTQAQGKGIGKKLIDAVENHLDEETVLLVATQTTNTKACDFYHKTGFTIYKKQYIYHYVSNTI